MMSKAATRLAEFKAGTGRYDGEAVRAYDQSPERVALIRRQSNAVQTARKSREEWKARAKTAEKRLAGASLVAEALSELAVAREDAGVAFAAGKIREAIGG